MKKYAIITKDNKIIYNDSFTRIIKKAKELKLACYYEFGVKKEVCYYREYNVYSATDIDLQLASFTSEDKLKEWLEIPKNRRLNVFYNQENKVLDKYYITRLDINLYDEEIA